MYASNEPRSSRAKPPVAPASRASALLPRRWYGPGSGPIAIDDLRLDHLRLDHLWIVHPGQHAYPIDASISALPLVALPRLREELDS